jgi:hypothetical protein
MNSSSQSKSLSKPSHSSSSYDLSDDSQSSEWRMKKAQEAKKLHEASSAK